ncbi:MAG TPA: hypothetical protein VL307_16265, partial [Chitinophagaceae bacterium]|nr:hypothetical protein [Chitinophagaceae bacterium]
MFRNSFASLFILFLVAGSTQAQKLKKADKAVISNLEAHVGYLSDDKLEGRRAGSAGEKLATDYITAQWQAAGLIPKAENNSWLQAFDISDGKEISKET